jgi:hypothetical protein
MGRISRRILAKAGPDKSKRPYLKNKQNKKGWGL